VNIGTFIEMERHEAAQRAMDRFYRKRQLKAARERRTSTTSTGLRPGARRISRAEALELIRRKNPWGARRLAQAWGGVPSRRDGSSS
jgi:hypothetical protein